MPLKSENLKQWTQLLHLPLQYGAAKVAQEFQELWFKACVHLLGQIRFKNENQFITKLDCWHLAFLTKLQPGTQDKRNFNAFTLAQPLGSKSAAKMTMVANAGSIQYEF